MSKMSKDTHHMVPGFPQTFYISVEALGVKHLGETSSQPVLMHGAVT